MASDFAGVKGVETYKDNDLTVMSYNKIVVDGARTLDQLIRGTKQAMENPDINEVNFPIIAGPRQERNLHMFTFTKIMDSYGRIIAIMGKFGKRPGFLQELLTFGCYFADAQKDYILPALGSVARIKGKDEVACLTSVGNERCLSLISKEGLWPANCAFIAADR